MANFPLISVIVPVYNGEKFLAECIDSILDQSYNNLELILVNDGSTDSSQFIIDRYALHDPRVRHFTTANRGVSAARNLALDNARGALITFVDADDFVTVDFLEILFILITRSGADVAVSSYTHKPKHLGLHQESFHVVDAMGFTADVLFQRVSDTAIWGKLFRAKLWSGGMRFADMRYEDLEIIPRLYLNAKTIAYTTARLYYYRLHDTNFFNTFSPSRLDVLSAIKLIEESVASRPFDSNIAAALTSRRLAASFNLFMLTYKRSGFEHVAEDAWRDIKSLRWKCLTDRRVINKIKLGIIASYSGKHGLNMLNRIFRISN
ncbi:MAG: glycosyltransferase [Clostridiales bacterium]|nr:glycosyltransferase [Clostridiales bacterium]